MTLAECADRDEHPTWRGELVNQSLRHLRSSCADVDDIVWA